MYFITAARLMHRDKEAEEGWIEAEERYQAERAFRRARLGSILRRLKSRLFRSRNRGPSAAPIGGAGGSFELEIDRIEGISKATGFRSLPSLDRACREAWCREYRRDGAEAERPAEVVEAMCAWYLVDVDRALIRLEIARARGIATISVVARKPERPRRGPACRSAIRDEPSINPLAASSV